MHETLRYLWLSFVVGIGFTAGATIVRALMAGLFGKNP
jgi:hypothetical protein